MAKQPSPSKKTPAKSSLRAATFPAVDLRASLAEECRVLLAATELLAEQHRMLSRGGSDHKALIAHATRLKKHSERLSDFTARLQAEHVRWARRERLLPDLDRNHVQRLDRMHPFLQKEAPLERRSPRRRQRGA